GAADRESREQGGDRTVDHGLGRTIEIRGRERHRPALSEIAGEHDRHRFDAVRRKRDLGEFGLMAQTGPFIGIDLLPVGEGLVGLLHLAMQTLGDHRVDDHLD
ncbi:MAG: hypothetical protein ACK55I_26245, partial [bacterium]